MAINAEDRYPTANEFRGALARVGRSETLVSRMFTDQPRSQAAGHSIVNTVVVNKAASPAVDPFGSYSILKPAETSWVAPRTNRLTSWIAVSLISVIVAGFGTMYGFGSWIDPKTPGVDFAKTNSRTAATGSSVARQSGSDPHSKVSGSNPSTALPAAAVEPNRKGDTQKRRTSRADNARSQPVSAKPPHFSITP
jgi:hypothetical protein